MFCRLPPPKKGAPQPQPKQYAHPAKNDEFMERASIPQSDPDRTPVLAKRLSYNDDLRLGRFTQSKLVWPMFKRRDRHRRLPTLLATQITL